MPDTLAELENRYTGPIPPAALAAARAEQSRRRNLPLIVKIRQDLEAAEMTLADLRACLHLAVRARWQAEQILRVTRQGPMISAAAMELAKQQDRAEFALKHFKSARELVAWNEKRLAEAMAGESLQLAAAE